MTSKFFGTVLIVAGTTIGASMLALPLKTAAIGFPLGLVFMVASWLFMLANSYITLIITKPYPVDATFHTIAKDVFGLPGWLAMTTAVLWLFYALLAAYAAGASTLIAQYFGGSPQMIGSFIFAMFAVGILWNTQVTDYMNRVLFIVKLVIFSLLLWPLLATISGASVLSQLTSFDQAASLNRGSIGVLLIYITSFGFHGSITSLIQYNQGNRPALRSAFFAGTLLSVGLYLIWILLSLALVGEATSSLTDMVAMIGYIGEKTGRPEVSLGLNIFALLAVFTSFLGVGLGLSNYFQDMISATPLPKRLTTGALTFLPPYFMMMLYPGAFMTALEFAGVALVFIAVLMPNLIFLRQVSRGTLTCSFGLGLSSALMLLAACLLIPLYFVSAF